MPTAESAAYRLGEPIAAGQRHEWRTASRDGSCELLFKIARDARGQTALAVERRRVAALRDEAPETLAPLVDSLALEDGRAALVYARARGAPLSAALPLGPAQALALAASTARLSLALERAGLALERLSGEDFLYDPTSERIALVGLSRIRPSAGRDPAAAAVAWGELAARALGAPRTARGYLLEKVFERARAELLPRPDLVALVRSALAGETSALEKASALSGNDPASRARELRARAQAGLSATIHGPQGLVYHVIGPLEASAPGAADESPLVAAICARTGSLVLVATPVHGTGADPAQVRAARGRIEADFDRARTERAARFQPLLRFRAAPIDRSLARSFVPELRREEAYAIYAWGERAPASKTEPLLLDGFSVSLDDGKARLALAPGKAKRVVVVRASPGKPVLVPQDGARLLDLQGDAIAKGGEEAVPRGDARRYAAFAVAPDGSSGVPIYARLSAREELQGFQAASKVGKVALAWSAPPPQARAIVVRVSTTEPPASPEAGDLAYWGKNRRGVEVAAESGKTLFARAFLLGADLAFSRGVEASALSWHAPSPATAFQADARAERVVRLSWAWPESQEHLSGAALSRDPPFKEEKVALSLGSPPSYVDAAPPIGSAVRYELATISAGEEARVEAAAVPWAELAFFAAEGAGEAVALSWTLPDGSSPDAVVRIVRRLDRAPTDLDDGDLVATSSGVREHMDGPLPAGTRAFYRAGLVLAGGLARSPGREAEAVALEKAGALEALVVSAKKRSLEVRWQEPSACVDDVALYAGPRGTDPVVYDRAAFLSGQTIKIEAPAGVMQKIKAVPRWKGREDASGAVSAQASAWDEVEGLVARAAPGAVELAWNPLPPLAQVVVRRRVDAKDSPWEELKVEPQATSFKDEPPKGKACIYRVSLRFSAGGTTVESEGIERKEQSRELPAELGSPAPKAKVAPGAITILYFEPKAKVNYQGTVIYESPRAPGAVEAAFKRLGREHHTQDDLAALGCDLAQIAERDKSPTPRVEVQIPVRDEKPRATTLVVATRNGPMRRVAAVLRALRLPAGVLAPRASVDEKSGKPRLEWTLAKAEGGTRLARLEVRRALNDPDESIPQKERERLEAPFSQVVKEGETSFLDSQAEDGVTFAYTLAATFEAEGESFEVLSAPASVRGGRAGGKLLLTAAQARGVFGFKKPPQVELTVKREGGVGAWPPFLVMRALEGAKGESQVASWDGGEQGPPVFKDEDLAAFTAGMSFLYSLKLARHLDARRVEVGSPAKVKLG